MNTKGQSIRTSDEVSQLMNIIIQFGPRVAQNRPFIRMAMAIGENYLIRDGKNRRKNEPSIPPGVIEDQTAMSRAILHALRRIFTERKLSKATYEKASAILMHDLLVEKGKWQGKSEKFIKEYGVVQPSFLLISPTKACNLRCIGCYADADGQAQSLEWELVDKAITEAHEMWGAQFTVISGGEPLAYRSQGKTILDLAEKHSDNYFIFYTNGTLITDEIAQRMADLGNVIPMISLEGWKERTDARRGAGVFDQVMTAMDRLYDAGVLYGVSLTATRENAEEILADDYIDFLLNKKHAIMGWIFQYMPIGRSYTLDLMPTPQQRLKMWDQSWKLVREKHYFLADFWNHGTAVDGCLSAGGHGRGGYLYIDWNGNVSPCVFLPFSPVNIKEVYARGGTLDDIYREPFFADLRKWQLEIKQKTHWKNTMNPCPMRDHNADLRQMIRKHEAEPIDQNAAAALQDAHFAEGMDAYDAEYQGIVDVVWEKVYEHDQALSSEEFAELLKPAVEQPLK
ncbi:MAG: radical SAM protein [Anaerolineaceae bacterium]